MYLINRQWRNVTESVSYTHLDVYKRQEQELVQRKKKKEFKTSNPELFGRYPKFSKALAKALDPSDEIKMCIRDRPLLRNNHVGRSS